MASPFETRTKREAEQNGPKRPSVEEAIAVLRAAADSPKAQAALRTFESELEHRGPENRKPSEGPPQEKTSPGQRQGFPAKGAVQDQMGGTSAKGDANSSPFKKRRAKAQATAKGY